MCRGHHHDRRHGFPSRDEWLERLQAHAERLEQDLANVRDLIERLGEPSGGGQQPTT